MSGVGAVNLCLGYPKRAGQLDSWMLKFIGKTASWWGEAGKEVKGAQAAGVELRGFTVHEHRLSLKL